ncbi:MAG: hypothetical protein CBC91_07515 [Rickettsiales bacterium TMED131]|nr:MAG: hypothetical protein CBC91_07515 [Rickettsiales bacterium TMED131]
MTVNNKFKILIDDYAQFDLMCRQTIHHWSEVAPPEQRVECVRAWYQWASNAYPFWFKKWMSEMDDHSFRRIKGE